MKSIALRKKRKHPFCLIVPRYRQGIKGIKPLVFRRLGKFV